MILTTTDSVQGKNITEYLGLVSAATAVMVTGSHKMMTNTMCIHAQNLQDELGRKAAEMGADAVVGIKYAAVGGNHFLIGTAVKIG